MPWNVSDVDKHRKGLSDAQKEQWVAVANAAYEQCMAEGGDDATCAPAAIQQANAAIAPVNGDVTEAAPPPFVASDPATCPDGAALEEAATLKAQAQGLLRAADRLLANKALPQALRSGLQALRAELKRTWADLEQDSDKEKGEGEGKEGERVDGNVQEAAVYKTEDGKQFPASDYAYVPDPEKPGTWKLRLTSEPGSDPDPRTVGMAIAALGKGFRGNKAEIPAADLPKVKARIRAAWRKANPDQDEEDMPEVIKEASDMDFAADIIPIQEKAISEEGFAFLKLIAPGWGSSGYYSAAALKDAGRVFIRGLKMFWDHPTAQEEATRPERSLRDLAAELVEDAQYLDDGPAGPGLYAKAKVFSPFRAAVEELAPHIGVSIRGMGKARQGEVAGRKGQVIEQIMAAKSVDFVTTPGAGGRVLQLFESYRGGGEHMQEELQKLRGENEALQKEVAELRRELALGKARAIIGEAVSKAELPSTSKARLVKELVESPTAIVLKEGALDREALQAAVASAIKAEMEYVAAILGEKPTVTGMGSGKPAPATATLKESFKRLYLRQGLPEAEAEKLAALAVGA